MICIIKGPCQTPPTLSNFGEEFLPPPHLLLCSDRCLTHIGRCARGVSFLRSRTTGRQQQSSHHYMDWPSGIRAYTLAFLPVTREDKALLLSETVPPLIFCISCLIYLRTLFPQKSASHLAASILHPPYFSAHKNIELPFFDPCVPPPTAGLLALCYSTPPKSSVHTVCISSAHILSSTHTYTYIPITPLKLFWQGQWQPPPCQIKRPCLCFHLSLSATFHIANSSLLIYILLDGVASRVSKLSFYLTGSSLWIFFTDSSSALDP